MTNSIQTFEKYRLELFHLAYGMLGRVAPAEDAVQETFIRWQTQDIEKIQLPKVWLSKVVNRICLDEIKSARNRREQYIGLDLPEPILAGKSESPDEAINLGESLSMAMQIVLDRLTPVQRAVFLLREVFDYDYTSIASIIDKSESNCRKIGQRARSLVRENRPSFDKNTADQHRVVSRFVEAFNNHDMPGIEQLLAEEAILYPDGGGKVNAARKPIQGAGKIAKFLVNSQRGNVLEFRTELKEINGEPGLIFWTEENLFAVVSFHIEIDKIKSICVVLNPEKLEHIKRKNDGHRIL